jgi:hypothetical protein
MSLKHVTDCPDLAVSQCFVENRAHGDSYVVQEFLGGKIALLN